MSQELYYTSLPKGLDPGSTGFCTVAATKGMSPRVREKLQALSGYKHLFAPLDPRNPVACSHVRQNVGGKNYHILSRIGDAPLDYSGRSNYLAHHVALEESELPRGGPAWLLSQPGYFATGWKGEPRWLDPTRTPQGDVGPARCAHWERAAGDAGWAGVLVEEYEKEPTRPVFVVVNPGTDVLALFAEALALMPAERRWEVSFSTCFQGVQAGATCAWRGIVKAGREEDVGAMRGGTVIDLTVRQGVARDGPFVESARTGRPSRRPMLAAPSPSSRAVVEPVANHSGRSAPVEQALAPDPTRPPVVSQRKESAPAKAKAASGGGLIMGVALGVVFTLIGATLFYYLGGPHKELKALKEENENLKASAGPSDGSNPAAEVKELRGRVLLQDGDIKAKAARITELEESLKTAQGGNKGLAELQTKLTDTEKKLKTAELKQKEAEQNLVAVTTERDTARADASKVRKTLEALRKTIKKKGVQEALDLLDKDAKADTLAAVQGMIAAWIRDELSADGELKYKRDMSDKDLEQLTKETRALFNQYALFSDTDMGKLAKHAEAESERKKALGRCIEFLKKEKNKGTLAEVKVLAMQEELVELGVKYPDPSKPKPKPEEKDKSKEKDKPKDKPADKPKTPGKSNSK